MQQICKLFLKPILEKQLNEVATPLFSYSQLEENSNSVQIDSMKSVEALNENVGMKSNITSVKRHFKKKLVKFILFLFLFLIITIPFIVTLIFKSRNIQPSKQLISVASAMFYVIPAFVSTFLILSDVNLKRNFYKIFTCKKKATLDRKYLQATTGDLQNLSELFPTYSKRDLESSVCVKWKGENKIKIAWPSFSDEAASNRSDVDDVQSFHSSSSISFNPFEFVEELKVVYRSSSFNESFVENKNNLVKKIRPSSMPAEILNEDEELNHRLL